MFPHYQASNHSHATNVIRHFRGKSTCDDTKRHSMLICGHLLIEWGIFFLSNFVHKKKIPTEEKHFSLVRLFSVIPAMRNGYFRAKEERRRKVRSRNVFQIGVYKHIETHHNHHTFNTTYTKLIDTQFNCY